MLHSVSANEKGTRAYLSYWDAGMIMLDISVPEAPTFLGRAKDPVTDEGNLPSAVAVPGERLAVTTDEDFSGIEPGGTWGAARIWDIADPTKPVQIGQFRTPNSSSSRSDGWFTVHNPQVRGNRLYLSWYSDGLRVVDISRPDRPREVASFVPPSGQDGTPPLVWGVRVERNLIFLSDMSTGLYILRTGS